MASMTRDRAVRILALRGLHDRVARRGEASALGMQGQGKAVRHVLKCSAVPPGATSYGGAMGKCSKIISPPNCNETLSPYRDGDDESERVPTSESDCECSKREAERIQSLPSAAAE
jgi:hypothetical protein